MDVQTAPRPLQHLSPSGDKRGRGEEEQTVEELLTDGDPLEAQRARQNPRTEPVWEEQLGMSREPPGHVPIRRRHHHPGHSQRIADRM